FTLSNGLRLIVLPESISNTVSIYGHILNKPEMETPKGQDGVDQMLVKLFPFGSVSLDRVAFQKALDDIGMRRPERISLSRYLPHISRGA
ncbi:MAG: insulinase family protein, partial [Thermodesulfobacteriota bacterium]